MCCFGCVNRRATADIEPREDLENLSRRLQVDHSHFASGDTAVLFPSGDGISIQTFKKHKKHKKWETLREDKLCSGRRVPSLFREMHRRQRWPCLKHGQQERSSRTAAAHLWSQNLRIKHFMTCEERAMNHTIKSCVWIFEATLQTGQLHAVVLDSPSVAPEFQKGSEGNSKWAWQVRRKGG